MSLVAGLVDSIVAVHLPSADVNTVTRVLGDARRLRGWLDSVEVAAARRLDELARLSPSIMPERAVAEATRVSVVEASRGFERAKTVDAVPQLGCVLAAGQTSAGHVDVVSRALRDLNADQQRVFAGRGDVLAAAAASLPRDEFARTVRREVRNVCADDGISRLERQKRNTRLRTWVDRDTGMWCLHGQFDPETGLTIDRQLQSMLERLFHDTTPDTCPTDPVAKQHHLRALAFVAICDGRAGRTRTELNILIDAQTLADGEHTHSHIDLGIDIDLPIETVQRMACCAEVVVPIITASDSAALHLGRQQRQPSRTQRRALRAMYRCCAIPGCTVSFDHCNIHHLRWWRNHGPTDIENLLPLCHKHHHAAHEGGWKLKLDRFRNLAVTYPDGVTMTTGPPRRTSR